MTSRRGDRSAHKSWKHKTTTSDDDADDADGDGEEEDSAKQPWRYGSLAGVNACECTCDSDMGRKKGKAAEVGCGNY